MMLDAMRRADLLAAAAERSANGRRRAASGELSKSIVEVVRVSEPATAKHIATELARTTSCIGTPLKRLRDRGILMQRSSRGPYWLGPNA